MRKEWYSKDEMFEKENIMRWVAYDPKDAEKKDDELSDDELDDVAGGGNPPIQGYP